MTFLLKSLKKKKGLRRYIGPKRIILLCILATFVIWAWGYYKSGALSPSIIEAYRGENPIGAVLLFTLIYAISVIAALPALPLNLAAGFFWGGILGGVYSTIGVTLGGWISFLAARWLVGQPLADSFEKKWASKVQEEFEQNGWKFVAFVRLNPIIPTGPLNYLLGLTSLSNRAFVLTTFIFILAPATAVAYVGESFQTFSTQDTEANKLIHVILITSAAVTALFCMKYLSKTYKSNFYK